MTTTPFEINEDVWLDDHVKEVLPVIRHVLPQFFSQNNRVLQISELEVHLADHYRVNELFLLEHLE